MPLPPHWPFVCDPARQALPLTGPSPSSTRLVEGLGMIDHIFMPIFFERARDRPNGEAGPYRKLAARASGPRHARCLLPLRQLYCGSMIQMPFGALLSTGRGCTNDLYGAVGISARSKLRCEERRPGLSHQYQHRRSRPPSSRRDDDRRSEGRAWSFAGTPRS